VRSAVKTFGQAMGWRPEDRPEPPVPRWGRGAGHPAAPVSPPHVCDAEMRGKEPKSNARENRQRVSQNTRCLSSWWALWSLVELTSFADSEWFKKLYYCPVFLSRLSKVIFIFLKLWVLTSPSPLLNPIWWSTGKHLARVHFLKKCVKGAVACCCLFFLGCISIWQRDQDLAAIK
jgi:hypothetical protein